MLSSWRGRPMLLIECALVLLAAVVACASPDASMRLYSALGLATLERSLARLARRRALSVIVVGLTALALRLAVLPIEPIPVPGVHDEFSYLLMSDTFSHGRLANPTHPMWIHFESFHINQKPTYASIYYPAQGLFLAFGQVFLHHPFWGVVLSSALMCAALCWMLQAWFPPLWALLGALLAVIRLATFSYWVNSYFGGYVAALGGALVLGALPRIKRQQRVRDALLMGLGLALLANTRPYESLFFCLPIAAVLLIWMFGRSAPPLLLSLRRVLLPLSLVLAITVGAMGYYFWRVTGSPIRIPYQVNISAYHLVYFPWQKLQPAALYRHAVMKQFYQGPPVLDSYSQVHRNPLLWILLKPLPLAIFFLGPVLLLPVLAWIAIRPRRSLMKTTSRNTRFLLLVCGCTMIGLTLPIYLPMAHYAAPMTAAVYALVLQSMRYVRLWKWDGKPSGLFLVRAVPVICLGLLPVRTAASALHIPVPVTIIHTWYSEDQHNIQRARVINRLEREPGQHLVFVRYEPEHEIFLDCVYH